MLDCTRLMVQPQNQASVITTVNLLIVAVSKVEATVMLNYLKTDSIRINYDLAVTKATYHNYLCQCNYDAVLCVYHPQPRINFCSPLKVWQELQEKNQYIPVIVVGENVPAKTVVEWLKFGVADYISKEKILLLPERIKQTLKSWDQKQQNQQQLIQFQPQEQQKTIISCILPKMRENINLDIMLQNAVDLLQKEVGVSRCLLIQPDAMQQMQIRYVSESSPQRLKLLNICCEVAEYNYSSLYQGNPLIYSDLQSVELPELQEAYQKYQVKSLLLVPIIYQQELLGAICLHHCYYTHEWTAMEIEMVTAIATQCGLAILQEQLSAKIKQQKQKDKLLMQIATTLNSNLKPPQILDQILLEVGNYFAVERVLIFRVQASEIAIEREWRSQDNIPSLLNLKTSVQELPELIDTNLIEAYNQDTNNQLNLSFSTTEKINHSPNTSLLTIPLFLQEQLFGGLALQTISQKRHFSETEIQTAKYVAQQIALALYNTHCYQQLEKQFQEQAKRLEEEKKLSEEANRAKSEFLSTMSHELRTPLTGIIGFSRMLAEEIYGELNPKQKQYVGAISASGEHLLALINDLLDISKIEADREELFWEKVAIEDICLASISIVQERARQEGLELKLDLDPQINFCYADQRRLKQIIVNLLSNAIKFTEKGSVILKVAQEEENISFSVIDTGIGISPEDQQKLFQPFQQLQSYLNRKHKGTGLGLALSRKLAKLHGGDLTLKSELGQGSCFTLYLPVTELQNCHR